MESSLIYFDNSYLDSNIFTISIQIWVSFQNLLQQQTIDLVETVNIKDIEDPLIMICLEDNWNFTKVRESGYTGGKGENIRDQLQDLLIGLNRNREKDGDTILKICQTCYGNH